MNLAITDIFIAVGGILPELILNLTVHFYAPDIICRLVKYMSGTATYASSFALAVLSFDRAEAVINPLRSTKNICFGAMHRRGLAICGWVAACICGLPSLILANLKVHKRYGPNCLLNFDHISTQAYFTSVAVTVFILPALFITICHVVMVVRIWQAAANTDQNLIVRVRNPAPPTKKLRRPIGHIFRDSSINSMGAYNTNASRCANFAQLATSSGCIPRARIKTVKMTLVIVSAYIICWCPYMIYNLLMTYRIIGPHTPRLAAVSPLIQHLVTLNSSANPAIFWMFSAHTIITERRRNRRSKVVQRHHRRWKCNERKLLWHCHAERSEDAVMLKARRNEGQNASNQSNVPNINDNADNDLHSEYAAAPLVIAAAAPSNSFSDRTKGENSQIDKEEITPIGSDSRSHRDF
ncbi:hypothetical protein Aperf_G00000032666 [Anoplocephala perfoliata]